jgi:hypothetical protein
VANHGHPRIRGWPPRLDLGCNTTKSAGYSHESTEITKSSITPSGLMVERSTNSRTVGVGQDFCSELQQLRSFYWHDVNCCP